MSDVQIGLKPASALLTLVKGDQWRRPLYLMDDAAEYDATGATLTASVRRTITGAELFAPALEVVDLAEGQYTIDITEAQSATLTAGNDERDPKGAHWLVLRLLDANSVTITLAQIRMQVVP